MINNINLADIRSFVLIAQLGNFTKAAEALNVSRSHVSRQITALEKHMGVTLLIRTTRTLKLTEAGKTLFSQCNKALNEIDQALLGAVDDIEQIKGNIKINCVGGYLGENVIAEVATKFMQSYPDVTINLDFSSHRVDLIEDEFDIAFRMGKLEDSGFIARKLMDIEMLTLASPIYLQQKGKPIHPKDLHDHNCLTGSVKRWHFAHKTSKEQVDVMVKGRLECKNGRVLIKGAVNANGIIRVPKMYCNEHIENGELVEVFDNWTIPSVDFSILYHRDRFQPKRLQVFLKYLQDTLNH